jgi:hypothetical protein
MLEETIGQNEGVGYADNNINDATGTSGVSSAFKGYNPDDGTYVGKKSKVEQFKMLPTNTGDSLVDKNNSLYNDAMSLALMDSNLLTIKSLEDPMYGGGHSIGEGFRDGMDDYALWEYGKSKYDTNLNAKNEEDIKLQRNTEQSSAIVFANGLPRLAIRAAGTVASAVGGIVKGLSDATGGNGFVDKYLSSEAAVNATDKAVDWWNEKVPVYSTKEQEEASALSAATWTSGSHWANMIDNTGFTIGAVLAARVLGSAGAPLMVGSATIQAGNAVLTALTSEDAKERTAWQNLLPLALSTASAASFKFLPAGIKNRVAELAAGITSAAGEAETEAINARKEYIDEKVNAIKANVDARKQEVMSEYSKMINSADTDEERETLIAQMQNQLGILDWQGVRGANRAYKDSESVANITRGLNYAILTGSNIIQFGKMMTGGWKTYNAMGQLRPTKEAQRFAEEVYRKELANAGSNAAKRSAVKASKEDIMNKALLEYKRVGKDAFDETTKLSLGKKLMIGVKMPFTEGSEEMPQSLASNIGKGYAERNTDDYYGQISGLEQFRKAETGFWPRLGISLKHGRHIDIRGLVE